MSPACHGPKLILDLHPLHSSSLPGDDPDEDVHLDSVERREEPEGPVVVIDDDEE